MKFATHAQFDKEFKKLAKKFRTLPEDFERIKKIIKTFPTGEDSRHATILRRYGEIFVLKRRMLSRSTRRSDFRIIYMYDGRNIEILFIEIYFKGTQVKETDQRINKIFNENVM